MKNGNKEDAYNDHGNGKAKIVLNKPHPISIGLSRRRNKSNGTGLCAHDAQQNQPPVHAAIGKKVAIEVTTGAAAVNTVDDYPNQTNSKYNPVELAHANVLVNQ